MLSDEAQTEQFSRGGVAPAQGNEELPPRVSDAEIGRRARDAIEYEVCVPIPNDCIHLSSMQGQITVSGEVDWLYEKQAVELALQLVKGVRGVLNDLTVRTSAPQIAAAKRTGNGSGRKRNATSFDRADRIVRSHRTAHQTRASVVQSC
jgi:osmotically-inducible protein OsmY